MLSPLVVAAVMSVLAAQGEKPRATVAGTPYASLFQQDAQPQPHVKPGYGRVVEITRGKIERGPCGMPIIAADAEVDPGMIAPIPEKDRNAARIRAIQPECFRK